LTFTGTEATLVFLDSEIATPDQELVGPTWEIDTFIDGETANATNLVDSPTLSFSADGSVEIFGGCNRGGGLYEVDDDGSISFSELMSTYMACDDSTMAAEEHIFGVLEESGLIYEIDANRLTIMGATLGISGSVQE
jgi:heat shock protein HslJ